MKCLVLSGGAEKGIAYIGVLKYLEENHLSEQFEAFLGSSIGGIVATLISIGYTSKELAYIVKKINIRDLMVSDEFNLAIFLESFGFFEPAKIIKLIELLIKKKTNQEDLTFIQHYGLFSKKLTITGSCLSDYKCYYFNYLNTPDMRIIDALRISISIPILFKPHSYQDKLFVDGAVFDNYPIQEAMKYYSKEDILGCLININFLDEKIITNIDHYIKCCIRAISIKFNYLSLKIYADCSIVIHCEKPYYNFANDSSAIDDFISLGYQSADSFFINKETTEIKTKLAGILEKDIQI